MLVTEKKKAPIKSARSLGGGVEVGGPNLAVLFLIFMMTICFGLGTVLANILDGLWWIQIRDFQKALETTTAMKRHKILCQICSNCAVSNLSLRGHCISRSLHDAAKVVISRLLTRNCCGLAVVVSVIICLSMMARWRSRRFTVVATLVVVSRSLPLWDLGGSNWDTRKS